jgi:hypothetical protein
MLFKKNIFAEKFWAKILAVFAQTTASFFKGKRHGKNRRKL